MNDLNSMVDFDVPFIVRNGRYGGVVPNEKLYAPNEVFFDSDKRGQANDLDISDNDWEPLTGYSGQDSYRGACMHASETLSGGLERAVLEEDGIYVIVCVYSWDEDSVPDSWAVLRYTGEM